MIVVDQFPDPFAATVATVLEPSSTLDRAAGLRRAGHRHVVRALIAVVRRARDLRRLRPVGDGEGARSGRGKGLVLPRRAAEAQIIDRILDAARVIPASRRCALGHRKRRLPNPVFSRPADPLELAIDLLTGG